MIVYSVETADPMHPDQHGGVPPVEPDDGADVPIPDEPHDPSG